MTQQPTTREPGPLLLLLIGLLGTSALRRSAVPAQEAVAREMVA